ncbi:MAG: Transcriptional regulator, LysR family [Myxococcaceae bacterium]|nr:Transcriptional regulator, LysR family [Myxococcaceae bacterium]
MLDWNDLRYFLAIERAGTIARAASALGINPTTVTRRLSALEDRLQAKLFDRMPDGYSLTPAGQDLLERAARMEVEALAVERDVIGADRRASGTVRVSTVEILATRFIAPRMGEFAARYPDITLDLTCTTRVVSLARREADVVLRLVRPQEENVIVRKLTTVPLGLYASRAYLERAGMPEHAEHGLAGHRVVLFSDAPMFASENDWLERRLHGATVALRCDSVSSVYAAAVAGVGVALLPRRVADRDDALLPIATESAPEPRVVWQASHEAHQKSARVRAVLDFLRELFSE